MTSITTTTLKADKLKPGMHFKVNFPSTSYIAVLMSQISPDIWECFFTDLHNNWTVTIKYPTTKILEKWKLITND